MCKCDKYAEKQERNQEGGKYYSLVIWINPKNKNNNFQNTYTKFHSFLHSFSKSHTSKKSLRV